MNVLLSGNLFFRDFGLVSGAGGDKVGKQEGDDRDFHSGCSRRPVKLITNDYSN